MAADRFSINKTWDQIQSKHVGTGHSDLTKFEWASNQHRDTLASHVGHFDMYEDGGRGACCVVCVCVCLV